MFVAAAVLGGVAFYFMFPFFLGPRFQGVQGPGEVRRLDDRVGAGNALSNFKLHTAILRLIVTVRGVGGECVIARHYVAVARRSRSAVQ